MAITLSGTAGITLGASSALTFGDSSTLPSATFSPIYPVSASVAASALTITLNACSLAFRSTTLGSGTTSTATVTSPITLTVPSTATLGTVSAVQSQLMVLAINNGGTVELAVVNLSGGTNLDETTLITTTTISSGATSASTAYSTTGRSSVAFRVVGTIISTQATAGTWITAPSTIQGMGGQALTSMQSLGFGQVWTDVGPTGTNARVSGTTYYNTTSRPITVTAGGQAVSGSPLITAVVAGVTIISWNFPYGTGQPITFIVPPGQSYSITFGAGTGFNRWIELR